MANHKKKIKTAAIYDRWLSTLGGGEQVAFAYAAALRDLGYKTSILTHQAVDKKLAQRKMNVDLTNISIEYLPEKSSKELSEYTEKFDVFINTSYLDYFPNRSKLGILSVFFPDQLWVSPFEYLKRKFIIPAFKQFFIYPLRFEGFAYDEFKDSKTYRWMNANSNIVFNKPVAHFSIELYLDSMVFSVLDSLTFSINKKIIKPTNFALNHKSNTATYFFANREVPAQTFSIKLPDSQYAKKIALTTLTITNWRYSLYNLFKKMFPRWEMRLHGGPGITTQSELESYHHIVTISEFCRKWITKYWDMESIVLYPPVDTQNFVPSKKKKNMIIHVGRFFVTGHSKKQYDLVKAFQRLVDEHQITDWELHFVGSVHPGTTHQEYFNQTQHEAQGYPIYFHIDAPFSQLQQLLAQSKIYWHATGLDNDEEKDPILFEHFGITTVESMAAGCVPVVINGGGQKEIVTKESGLLWNDRDELVSQTKHLIDHPELITSYSKAAVERSKYFDRREFYQRFSELISRSIKRAKKA